MKKIFIFLVLLFLISCGDSQGNKLEEKDPCESIQCENGKCIVDIGSNKAECNCNEGYIWNVGENLCVRPVVDLCDPNPCTIQNQTKCTIVGEGTSASHKCNCNEGYIWNVGENLCVRPAVDPCENKQCDLHEECKVINQEAICSCKPGYELGDNNICKEIIENQTNSILIYGDTRDHEEEVGGFTIPIDSKHPEVVSAMVREIVTNPNDIKYIFNTGDLVYDGNDNEAWVDFFQEIDPFLELDIAYYPVLGNHEHDSDNYFSNFNLTRDERYYTLDIYGVRFIALDSNVDISVGSTQYNWLVDKLDNSPSNTKFIAVLFHHPLFSSGHHGGDKELRAVLHPLFIEKKVDLVFNGHDHSYERLEADGIKYIVTGGGGAVLDPTRLSYGDYDYSKKFASEYHYTLLTINKDKIIIEAKDRNNNIFDTITVNTQR